jgi:dTDP-glucose pyrophosphorylase
VVIVQNISVVYMVAGLSSRFGGKVKQFVKVGPNGETLIELSVQQALKAGFNKIIFIVGDKTEILFKEKFGNNYKATPIFYAKQTFNPSERDKPWGTADAVVCAKEIIKEPFVVCNGDDIYGENTFKVLFDWMKQNSSSATIGYDLIKVIPEKGSVNRGMFSVNESGFVTKINETLGIEKSNFESMGLSAMDPCSQNIFCLKPEAVELLQSQLNDFKLTHKGDRKSECYLPTELSNLIGKGKITLKLLRTPDEWIGVTNPEDEVTVREFLLKNKN